MNYFPRNELNLTHRDLKTVPDIIIDQYGSITEYLDLSHNRLTQLNWIYEFPSLRYLILDSNGLHEFHLRQLQRPLENITLLMLNRNEFGDLETTIALLSERFPHLEYLSLHGNPICPDGLELQPFSQYISYGYDYYRSHIVNAFSKLKFLDHTSVRVAHQFTGSTPQRDARILTFTPKIWWAKLRNSLLVDKHCTPLSASPERYLGCHSGVIRRISEGDLTYSGKNSEGNRYISNNDL